MRPATGIIIILLTTIVLTCKQKEGRHHIVDMSVQRTTTDEVYIKFLSDQIKSYPKAQDNYLRLSQIYKSSGRLSSAITLLEQAAERIPNNIQILAELGSLYMEQKDADALSTILDKIRRIDPNHMEFLKLSAGYSLLVGDHENSIYFSNRAMLANPYDDENYFLRGSAQMIFKDSLSALQSFIEAYKLKDLSKYFSKIFDVAMATGNYNIAFRYLSDFSTGHPGTDLCSEWGSYYRAIDQLDTAKYILRNCIAHRPDDASTYYAMANTYFDDRTDSALYYVNQYLEMRPDALDGMLLKARLLERSRNFVEARKFYIMAIQTDSTFTLAKDGLENLERKVAYLRLVRRREEIQQEVESLNQLNSQEINQ